MDRTGNNWLHVGCHTQKRHKTRIAKTCRFCWVIWCLVELNVGQTALSEVVIILSGAWVPISEGDFCYVTQN